MRKQTGAVYPAIRKLYGDRAQEQFRRFSQKKRITAGIVLLLTVFAVLLLWTAQAKNPKLIGGHYIERNEKQGSEKQVTLQASTKSGYQKTLQLHVMQQQYSEQELSALWTPFSQELKEKIFATGDSPDYVSKDLNLFSSLPGYPFRVQWRSEQPLLVSSDGRIHEEEWLGATMQFGAVSRRSGILARRVVYFYFGYDENNLYFAHRSELPPDPIKVGAKEECFLTVQPPGADKPAVFRVRERKAPEGQAPGHWESEIAIPLKELGITAIEYGKPWKLQMTRRWSDPDEIADWAGKEAATFIPRKDIPATGFMGFWIYGTKAYRGISCNFRWQAALTDREMDCVAEISSLEVPRQFINKLKADGARTVTNDWRQLLSSNVDYTLKYDISLRPGGELLQRRVIPWNSAKGMLWVDPDPPVTLQVGVYPTFGKAKARLNCLSRKKLAALKSVRFAIEDASGKALWSGEPETPASPLFFDLPKLAEGEYSLTATYIGQDGKEAREKSAFAIRKFPWQGLNLGAERLVVPPFKPLEVKDGCEVRALQTSFRLGDGGIAAVTAAGKELLAAPALLRIDGQVLSFAAPEIKEKSPDRVVMEASAAGKDLTVTAVYEFDYDGMVKITWNFAPKGSVLLKNMTFDLPLRKEYGQYLHVVGDGMRRNIHAVLPEKTGQIWDSRKVGRPNLFPGGFHPYIWLGDTVRGLSWFAETTFNWQTGVKNPAQEIIRSGDTVTLRINLTGAAGLRRDKPFAIVTGLQPTPVKPIVPDARRHSAHSWEAWAPEKSDPFLLPGNNYAATHWEVHPMMPPNRDFTLLKYFKARPWKTREEAFAKIDEFIKRNKLPKRWENKIFRYPDEIRVRLEQAAMRAETAKYVILYSNPRALVATWPEYDMYADEWNRIDWRTGRPSTLYSAFHDFDGTMEEALRSASPIHLIDRMPDIPYTIFHCEKDSAVSKRMHSDRFAEAAGSRLRIRYVSVPDRDHCDLPPEYRADYLNSCAEAIGAYSKK